MRKVHKMELKPGMILAKTLISADSNVLILERGAVLDRKKIEFLKQYELNNIYILGELDLSEEELQNIDEEINKLVDEAEKEAKEKGEFFERVSFLQTLLEAKKIKVDASDFGEPQIIYDEEHVKGLVFTKSFKVDLDSLYQPFHQRHHQLFVQSRSIFDEAQTGSKISISQVKDPLKKAMEDIKKSDNIMARLFHMEAKDSYTFDHSMRVMLLCVSLGKWLGYTQGDLEQLSLAALLFDLGKMKIPEFIIGRQQKLGTKEYEMIKRHAEFSYNILKEDKLASEETLQGVLLHHERMDGSGYPFGLKGNRIHEFAKIIAICDTFDALTSERSYARKRTILEAMDEIDYMAIHLLDPQMVYLFSNKLSNYYVGSKVILSTGFEGEIVYVNPKWPTKPVVKAGANLFDLKRSAEVQIIEMLYHM